MKTPLEVIRLYPEHDYTLAGAFESRMSLDPKRDFLVYGDKTWSWQEFHAAMQRAACMLVAHGIRKGDRVAIMARNSEAHVLLLFALARIGAIMVPVNTEFGVSEAAYVLKHAAVSAILCSSDTLAVAREAAQDIAPVPWFALIDGTREDVPDFFAMSGFTSSNDVARPSLAVRAPAGMLEPLVGRGACSAKPPTRPLAPLPGGRGEHQAETVSQPFPEVVAAGAPGAALPSDVSADDTCLIVYTSGTTGFPKGAMHSQRSFVTGGEAFVARVHVQADDRLLTVLPLFHINALFYSLAGTLAAGACIIVVPRFSASTFWQTAVDTGATIVNVIEAIGTILIARARSEFRPEHRISKLYGARQNVVEVFRNEFHILHMIGGYGMTEIPGVTCNPIDGPQKLGSMGPIGRHPDPARPWAQCRVVDDDGKDVGVDEVGELLVKTPIIMQGYYRDPEQTRAAFCDGWFMTGDYVRRDADGYFFFVSRKKDIIRRRGENIAGAELDRVIGLHPAVFEVAAIAVPAELGEDEILAAIVLKPQMQASAEEIADWCRARLAPMKVPRFVAFVESLPHTPTHKILKAQLRADKALRERAVDLQAQSSV